METDWFGKQHHLFQPMVEEAFCLKTQKGVGPDHVPDIVAGTKVYKSRMHLAVISRIST